jgi:hypothetical protein
MVSIRHHRGEALREAERLRSNAREKPGDL